MGKARHHTRDSTGSNPGADPTTTHNKGPDLTAKAKGLMGPDRIKALATNLTQHWSIRVHLSLFDGIGAASLALQNLGIKPILTMSWETDPECTAVLEGHFQPIHMGDITQFNIEQLIDTLLDNLDPNVPISLLITGGPPCPDFSNIRAHPTGTSGATGHLFQLLVDIIQQIKQVLQQLPIHILIENVVPHTEVQQDVQQLSQQLDIEPIIVDAEDGGVIHRRRLWWLSVHWTIVSKQLSQHTPWSLHWLHKDTPWARLHNQSHRCYSLRWTPNNTQHQTSCRRGVCSIASPPPYPTLRADPHHNIVTRNQTPSKDGEQINKGLRRGSTRASIWSQTNTAISSLHRPR